MRGHLNKSFHPFASLEVALVFIDQRPEYPQISQSPLARPAH